MTHGSVPHPSRPSRHAAGEIWLVGAGPGDPELLTVKATRRLAEADIILYDALVSEEILSLCNPSARRIHVGKRSGRHTLPQADISRLLVMYALRGKRVLRLKGGDPFMFGRGGEELDLALRAGVRCEIVPGITSAQGAAAATGIPLTHRDAAQSCVFVTGHRRQESAATDWAPYARTGQTLVVYMGVAHVHEIAAGLLQAGRAAQTPVAFIENATTPRQRTLLTTLGEMTATAEREALKAPALIIIGEVVNLNALCSRAQALLSAA
jgi:uroporphyrin-III C-methyltransferase